MAGCPDGLSPSFLSKRRRCVMSIRLTPSSLGRFRLLLPARAVMRELQRITTESARHRATGASNTCPVCGTAQPCPRLAELETKTLDVHRRLGDLGSRLRPYVKD